MEHLENGPYGKQILAYQVAFGCCGETTLWGAWRPAQSEGRGDYGITARRAFYQWILDTYGSRDAAMAVYGLDDLSPDCLPILRPTERISTCQMDLAHLFYQDQPGMKDYHRFLSQTTVRAIEYFGRLVHEKTDKPAGAQPLLQPQKGVAG